MFKIKIFLLVVVAFVALPQVSAAYFTTAQTATKLDADTFLFTVTYRFGLDGRDLRMPVLSRRGLSSALVPYAGYVIQNDGKRTIEKGDAYSIVLSDAKVLGNEYFVPAGKVSTFTLVTVLKLTPEMIAVADEESKLSLLMTNLPFTMTEEGKDIPARLNPSELQYYQTPALSIK